MAVVALVLEPSFGELRPLAAAFQEALGGRGVVSTVQSTRRLVSRLGSEKVDLVVMDCDLGDGILDGTTVLERLRRKDPRVPIVATSEREAPEIEAEAIGRGATEFLVRREPLAPRVAGSAPEARPDPAARGGDGHARPGDGTPPPLRQREGEIEVLAQYFLDRFMKEVPAFAGKRLAQNALDLLYTYSFPGNVRELKNIIERAVCRDTTNELNPEDIGLLADHHFQAPGGSFKEKIAAFERQLLADALGEAGGNQARAARRLGLRYHQLRHFLGKHGLDKEAPR